MVVHEQFTVQQSTELTHEPHGAPTPGQIDECAPLGALDSRADNVRSGPAPPSMVIVSLRAASDPQPLGACRGRVSEPAGKSSTT